MASPVATGGGEISIRIPAPAVEGAETGLNRFLRCVAFVEWAANAFGALAFMWATVVLLGGFCSNLDPTDFWYATAIIFIEAFRLVSYTSSEALNFKRNEC